MKSDIWCEMTIDIRTLRIQEKIISALCDIRLKRSDVAYLVNILSSAKDELSGYCDNSFPYEMANMCEHLSEEIYIFSYGKGDDNFTTTGLPSKITDVENYDPTKYFGKISPEQFIDKTTKEHPALGFIY